MRLRVDNPAVTVEMDHRNSFTDYCAEVYSLTGEIKNTYQRKNGYDEHVHHYSDIVLQRVIEDVDAKWEGFPSVG